MQTKLYCGIDLHSSNCYLGIIDQTGKRIFHRRVKNDLELILKYLAPFREAMESMTVESTYNWYWLVDGLIDSGYSVKLANPGAIQQYSGLKHGDDKTDSFWLAELLRLDILPTGYIYPRAERSLRDMLRRRSRFVQQRTAHILSIKSAMSRHLGKTQSTSSLLMLDSEALEELFGSGTDDLQMTIGLSMSTVRFMSEKIKQLERYAEKKIHLRDDYKKLLNSPGIGKILGLTIMLEIGDISRFEKVGNFTSYCRCANASRFSNGKKKGNNNSKNGNKYLSWALVEAAHHAVRHYPAIQKFYQRKLAKKNHILAIKATAAKLSKALYFMLTNDEEFDMKRAFC
jgi:transposase